MPEILLHVDECTHKKWGELKEHLRKKQRPEKLKQWFARTVRREAKREAKRLEDKA